LPVEAQASDAAVEFVRGLRGDRIAPHRVDTATAISLEGRPDMQSVWNRDDY
jgi:hypothetical protein